MSEIQSLTAAADYQAITQLIYRYCRAMDRIDADLGYTIWHEDGTADYGADIFQGSGRGFIDDVCEKHRHMVAHSHQISNIILDLNGDTAGSESYVTVNLRLMASDKLMQITVWARYIDQWSRRDGRWGIDKRVLLMDFDETREVTPMSTASRASRDRHDPSYSVLNL